MGGAATVTTDASPIAVAAALNVIERLERRWSRFLPTSARADPTPAPGPVAVRPSTALVVQAAMAGRALTGGWFDPVRPIGPRAGAVPDDPVGVDLVGVDLEAGVLHIPDGMALDLGGIAKGWAADVAARLLVDHGAAVVGVDVGGDVRVACRHPSLVTLAGPDPGDEPARIVLRDGGIAVSVAARVAAVLAATAARADILATACATAPLDEAIAIVARAGSAGWLRADDGAVVAVGEPDRFVLDEGWLTAARPG